jgi:Glycosyltransferases involved in cell wall biogenesis
VSTSAPTYSVVIPIYNEQESLPELQRRLTAVFAGLDGYAEAIFVDDGSTDLGYLMLVEMNKSDPRFKVAQLARNFGHQLAITAGIDLARGDAVIVMDGDLQHPPELIPELAARWRDGYEVVYGVMAARPEGGSSARPRACTTACCGASRPSTSPPRPATSGSPTGA